MMFSNLFYFTIISLNGSFCFIFVRFMVHAFQQLVLYASMLLRALPNWTFLFNILSLFLLGNIAPR